MSDEPTGRYGITVHRPAPRRRLGYVRAGWLERALRVLALLAGLWAMYDAGRTAGRKEAAQARGVQTGATALATWGATVEAGVSSPFVVDRRADTPPGGPWHRVGFAYWVRRADGAEVTSADAMASLRQWCAVAATERPAEAP